MRRLAERLRRELALLRAVVRARRGPFAPFKLTWILTERCALRCRACHMWIGTPHAGPDLATIDAVLAANAHLTWLNLSGGDPLEREDAPRILALVAARLPDLALLDVPTAGQDTDAVLAALAPVLESPIPHVYVTVSLDGPDDVHDRVRGRRGAAARARRTFERLRALRHPALRVAAGLTLSRHTLGNAPSGRRPTLARIRPRGVPLDALHVNLAHVSGHYYRNRDDPRAHADDLLAVIDELAAARRGLGALDLVERRYWTLARRYLSTGDVGGRCGALRASVFLGADLVVRPCSIHDAPLGDLRDVDLALARLPELPRARAVLGEVDARTCPGCWSPCEAFPTLLLGLGRPLAPA